MIIKVKKFVVIFKLCEGMLIGVKVMFWCDWMYEFVDWLIYVVLFWV